jgi:hypothetical protein
VTTDPVACSGGTALCFDFDPDETDPAETVLMQAGTRVFRRDGVELSQSDVSTGDGASIDAVPGATELQAALVVLSNDAGSGAVTGVLDGIDTADDGVTVRLNVTTDIGGTALVCLDADTDFVHVLVDDETVTIFEPLDPDLLETGMRIEAYGDATSPPSGCDFVADLLIVEPPPATS